MPSHSARHSTLAFTLVANTLPAYESHLRVRERKHPKFYFFDPGVVRALKRQNGTVAPEERGPLFEGVVYMLLRFYQERANLCDDISYWAPAEAKTTEVDFLIRRGKETIAVEVKAARTVSPLDFRGLRAVSTLPGLVRKVLVFQGAVPLRTTDGIDALPFGVFAELLKDPALWP